jgi:hypothetical protein
MKNPASPVARRAGLRIDKPTSNSRSYSPPAHAPQRPIARRRPNAPFADDLIPASGLGGLTVDVTGGSCRSLLALADGEER